MQRIVADPSFGPVCAFLFPEEEPSRIAALLLSCRSVRDFQKKFMYSAIYSIIDKTTDGVVVDGLDALSPDKSYLFVSNHRDIVLDAAFLQVLLDDACLPTSEITFGANLMQGQFVIDFGKSNKMFRVERPTTVASGREFLEKSNYLSNYIRHTITEKHESVWIAQRNGRTKDGDDRTDRGIITMLCQSGGADRARSLAELNIVPLSISYEWEPCDILKSVELCKRATGLPYSKQPGEDLKSILTGITQKKGRVHVSAGRCLTEKDLSPLAGLSRGEFTKAVAEMIDRAILSSYTLYPNNYIAHDILYGESSDRYSVRQKEEFVSHLSELDGYPESDTLKKILLGMYSAPVRNKAALSRQTL